MIVVENTPQAMPPPGGKTVSDALCHRCRRGVEGNKGGDLDMNYTARYANLETITPTIVTDPVEINPGQLVPLAFTDEPWNGGTTIIIDGPAYSAGLSKRAVPLPPNVSQFTMSYDISPGANAATFSQVHETDLMIVDPKGNLYNGSTQLNNITGTWEVVNATGDWVATIAKTGNLPPRTWTTVSVTYLVDWVAQTITCVAITVAGVTYPVNLTTPARSNSGWALGLIVIQLQDCVSAMAGAYNRDMRNIGITMQ